MSVISRLIRWRMESEAGDIRRINPYLPEHDDFSAEADPTATRSLTNALSIFTGSGRSHSCEQREHLAVGLPHVPSYVKELPYAQDVEREKKDHARRSSITLADQSNDQWTDLRPTPTKPLPQMPSAWVQPEDDLSVEFSSPYDVKYVGGGKPPNSENEVTIIRANCRAPPECGVFYFEIELTGVPSQSSAESGVSIGFVAGDHTIKKPPGVEPNTIGIQIKDGSRNPQRATDRHEKYAFGDIIGMGISYASNQVFFTKNGHLLGSPHQIDALYTPVLGLSKQGDAVSTNFGQHKFMYDVGDVVRSERITAWGNITKTKVPSAKDDKKAIQEMVLQLLQNRGFNDTAAVFAQEVNSERSALHQGTSNKPDLMVITHDSNSIIRQELRRNILDGENEKAETLLKEKYPDLYHNDVEVRFIFDNRKLSEIIRFNCLFRKHHYPPKAKTDDSPDHISHGNGNGNDHRNGNGHTRDQSSGGNVHCDIDFKVNDSKLTPAFDVDSKQLMERIKAMDPSDIQRLDTEAIAFGRKLNEKYGKDPNSPIAKRLRELWAMMAYQDPSSLPQFYPLFNRASRISAADKINHAILEHLGQVQKPEIETIYSQTEQDLRKARTLGGQASMINMSDILMHHQDTVNLRWDQDTA